MVVVEAEVVVEGAGQEGLLFSDFVLEESGLLIFHLILFRISNDLVLLWVNRDNKPHQHLLGRTIGRKSV